MVISPKTLVESSRDLFAQITQEGLELLQAHLYTALYEIQFSQVKRLQVMFICSVGEQQDSD